MAPDRLKTTHTQGLVAKASWIPVDNMPVAYTGFYEDGTDEILLRFSQTVNLHEDSSGLLPSLAMKFLVDGQISQNIFGMPSFKETDSWNFFDYNLKSRLDHFIHADDSGNHDQDLIDTIQEKLNEGTTWPFSNAVGNIGTTNEAGDAISNFRIPYELQFSSPAKNHAYKIKNVEKWSERVMEVGKSGATILEVWAMDRPGDDLVKIADIKL